MSLFGCSWQCGGVCSEDVDEDGICDVIDDCIGEFDMADAMVLARYECGCTSIEPGNAIARRRIGCVGQMRWNLYKDEDGDGCDDLDECVGELMSAGNGR